MRKLSKPCFITLEGVEGAGKSSQVANIIKYFEDSGDSILATREPGGTLIADEIRRLLVESHDEPLAPLAELLLYNASRVQHLQQCIRPALAAGSSVLCDRYTDATVAYQSYGRHLSLGTVTQLNELATDGLTPDLTLLFDCPPELGLARSKSRLAAEASREDRFETEALAFHERVRAGYLEIAARQKDRMFIIDASQDATEVWEQIQKVFTDRIE